MTPILFFLLLPQSVNPPPQVPEQNQQLAELLRKVEQSGRVVELVREIDDRIKIAPGAPPLLTFRYLEGRQRGRFGGLDLVLDDAGH
jgi:hypothetical protein